VEERTFLKAVEAEAILVEAEVWVAAVEVVLVDRSGITTRFNRKV
jgi:hypothetical protein